MDYRGHAQLVLYPRWIHRVLTGANRGQIVERQGGEVLPAKRIVKAKPVLAVGQPGE